MIRLQKHFVPKQPSRIDETRRILILRSRSLIYGDTVLSDLAGRLQPSCHKSLKAGASSREINARSKPDAMVGWQAKK